MKSEFPLELGPPEAFERSRFFLRSAGYTEDNLSRILKLPEICDFEQIDPATFSVDPAEAPSLAVLVRVFFLLQDVPAEEVTSHIPQEALQSFLELGLLRDRTSEMPAFCSTVWLYPVEGLLLVSDRNKELLDAVFPAISPLSYRFLRRMGRSPASEALDLCSGSGVAALVLSQNCERATASDVSPRAIHFARFNCQLNGRNNVAALESDIYSAFGTQTFDKIVAHPPYVPSISNTLVWRDGGATGEEPLRRVVEGLPKFLRPGGSCYASCGGFDTREKTFEQRVREWLGASHTAFDVLFAVEFDKSPWHLAINPSLGPSAAPRPNPLQLLERFAEIEATSFVTGALAIYRKTNAEADLLLEPLTLRTQLSPLTDGVCLDSFLGLGRWLSRPEAGQELGQLKPRPGSTLQVKVTHEVDGQELVPSSFVIESLRPFRAETKVDAEIVQVLLLCDGKAKFSELFQAARTASLIPEKFTLVDFLKFAAKMIERGYLEIDDAPWNQLSSIHPSGSFAPRTSAP